MTPSVLRCRNGDGRADRNSTSFRQAQKTFDSHCARPGLSLSKLWQQRQIGMFIPCGVRLLSLCEDRWREILAMLGQPARISKRFEGCL